MTLSSSLPAWLVSTPQVFVDAGGDINNDLANVSHLFWRDVQRGAENQLRDVGVVTAANWEEGFL